MKKKGVKTKGKYVNLTVAAITTVVFTAAIVMAFGGVGFVFTAFFASMHATCTAIMITEEQSVINKAFSIAGSMFNKYWALFKNPGTAIFALLGLMHMLYALAIIVFLILVVGAIISPVNLIVWTVKYKA